MSRKATLHNIMKDMGLEDESTSESKKDESENWDDEDDSSAEVAKEKNTKPARSTKQKTNQATKPIKSAKQENSETDEDISDSVSDSAESNSKPKRPAAIIKKMLTPTKSTKSADSKETRGPGRPRKNPIMEPLPKLGVVDKPVSNKNKMEMQYGNPHSIRKIFMLLKSMGCRKVFITFDKKKFTIEAEDHLQKSDILVECYGKHMNRYYCSSKYTIQIEHDVLAILFAQMSNNTHVIRFISRKKEGEDVNIHVVYTDRIMDVDSTYDVPIIGTGAPPLHKWSNPDKYPVSFTFDAKYFRTLIKNMETSKADKFIIQKSGEDDFRITHSRNSKAASVGCNYRYRNAQKIKLDSKLSKTEVFTVPIDVRYVKRFAQSLISDNIEIRADSKEPTIFVAEIDHDEHGDPAFKVIVRTKTFEYKPLMKE